MRKIRWSHQALRDLQELGRYLSSKNPTAARHLLTRLRERVAALVEFPMMGRIVPELMREELREILEKNYRIVYLVSDEFIDIVTVFEAHRLFPLAEDEQEE